MGESRFTLSRRRLLQGASAGLLLHGWGARARAQTSVDGLGGVGELSVGYLDGSDLQPSLRARPWAQPKRLDEGMRVVSAHALPLGDQSLAGEMVVLRVHGFYPRLPGARTAGFSSVMLTVLYPSPDPLDPAPLPVHAWQGMAWPAPTAAPPVELVVPLRDLDGGLEMVLEVFDVRPTAVGQGAARLLRGGPRRSPQGPPAPAPARSTLWTDFTVDFDRTRPKLQRGVYFLGLEPDLWRRPWQMRSAEAAGAPLLTRASVVVSVEPLAPDDPRRGDDTP